MANTRTRKINQNIELNTTYDFVANDGTFSGTVTGNSFVGPLTGNVTGTVSSLSNHDTGDLDEGTNLYFTTTRARDAFSEGTGVSITSGVIAIGQAVNTNSNVTFGSVNVAGDLNVTGTIDLSNADLNIGAADIIFDTTSAGTTRGLMWNVSGSGILSKIIGGGTDGGKVTLFANINDAITTGNIFEIKDGSLGSLFLGLSHAGILTAGGGTSTQWNTAYGWGNHAGLYAPTGYGIGGSSILGSGNDANSKTLTGFYYFASASNTPTTYFQAGVLGSYNGDFAQYGIGSNQEMYFRWSDNSWKTIIHSGNISSQSVTFATNAGTLDSIDSSQFLRSDESDTMNGNLDITGRIKLGGYSYIGEDLSDNDSLTIACDSSESIHFAQFDRSTSTYNTKMILNPSGSLGIGTTNPQTSIQIGDYTTTGGGVTGLGLTFAAQNNGSSYINFFDGNTTEGIYIRSIGESYGGSLRFGARWDDYEDKMIIKMYQTSAGAGYNIRMGLGTTDPESVLDVRRTWDNTKHALIAANTSKAINKGSYDTAIIQADDVTTLRIVERNSGSDDQVMTLSIGDGKGIIATTAQPLQFYTNGGPTGYGYLGLSGSLVLSLETNQRAYFTNNLGIGSSANSARLSVYGAANEWTGDLYASGTSGQSYGLVIRGGTNADDYNFYALDASSNTPFFAIKGNGNVGVGTSSPNKRFQVTHDTNDWVAGIKNYGADAYGLQIDLSGSTGGQLAYALGVYTQAGTGMFVRNNGYVGVGTTSPVDKLEIYSSTYEKIKTFFESPYTSGFKFSDYNGGIKYNAGIDTLTLFANHPNVANITFETRSIERVRIDSSGIVRINPTNVAISGGSLRVLHDMQLYNTLLFTNSAGTTQSAIAGTGGEMYIYSNGTSNLAIKIKSSGYTGIGSSDPQYRLDVGGDARATGNLISDYRLMLPNMTIGYWDATYNRIESGSLRPLFITAYSQPIYMGRNGSIGDFTLDTSGRIGIGTTSPGYKLDVDGTGRFRSALTFASGDRGFECDAAGCVSFYSNEINSGSQGVAGNLYFGQRRTNNLYFNAPATFSSSPTAPTFYAYNERNYLGRGAFRLTSASNNASTLDISVTDGTTSIYSNYYGGGTDNTIIIGTYANLGNQLVLRPDGNIGIGKTDPVDKLEIYSGTYHKIRTFFEGSYTSGFKFSDYNGGVKYNAGIDTLTLFANHPSVANITFETKSAEIMRINSSGNVGIGETNPGTKIDVKRAYSNTTAVARFTNSNTNPPAQAAYDTMLVVQQDVPTIRIQEWDGGNDQDLALGVGDGYANITTTQPLRIWSGCSLRAANYSGGGGNLGIFVATNGNVGIKTASISYALDVNGTIRATGDVYAYSDARVKENVETIDSALDKVVAMRGVSYNRTDNDDKTKKIGVIAQEIQKVLPEVVSEQEDGMLSVSYGNIVGVLIEAIKEQQKQIDELKALLNVSPK